MLEGLLTCVALAGQLRMDVNAAARLIHAGGNGVVAMLNKTPDPRLADAMREALLAAITEAPTKAARTTKRVAPRAIALRAVLPESHHAISAGERHLLGEWLDRLAAADE